MRLGVRSKSLFEFLRIVEICASWERKNIAAVLAYQTDPNLTTPSNLLKLLPSN